MREEAGERKFGVVVVDDEAPARALVREFLSRHTDFEILAECSNGFEAVKAIAKERPDLVLLDIQMPKLDGFEVLDLLEEKPAVIFVTAYDQYAVKAFEVQAVDYLLKPFGQERFDAVLGRRRVSATPTADLSPRPGPSRVQPRDRSIAFSSVPIRRSSSSRSRSSISPRRRTTT